MERGLNLLVIFVLIGSIVVEQLFTIAQKLGRQLNWCLTNVDCQYIGPSPELDCVKNFGTRSPIAWG